MEKKVSKDQGPHASRKVAAVTAFNLAKKQAGTKRTSAMKLASALPQDLKKLDLQLPPPKTIRPTAMQMKDPLNKLAANQNCKWYSWDFSPGAVGARVLIWAVLCPGAWCSYWPGVDPVKHGSGHAPNYSVGRTSVRASFDFACMEGTASSGFPIPAFTKTDFNVNARYGGGTALMMLTTVTLNTNFSTELCLIRCGFDGNHYEYISLDKAGVHSMKINNRIHTDQDGYLSPCLRFGFSRATVISNIAQMGHCGCIHVYAGPKNSGMGTVNTNICISPGKYGKALLVLCSAPGENGTHTFNTYFVSIGNEPSQIFSKTIANKSCDDLWNFACPGESLEITGPAQSQYGIWNCDGNNNSTPPEIAGKVCHIQTFNGSERLVLLRNLSKYNGHALLIMCSYSSGPADMTSSGLYLVTIQKWGVRSSFVAGRSNTGESHNDWFISADNNQLVVIGPDAPCRYGFISNIPEDNPDPLRRFSSPSSMATGLAEEYRGGVYVKGSTIYGWVSKVSQVKIMINGLTIELVKAGQLLEQPDGRFGFKRELTSEDTSPGLKLLQVYGITSNIKHEPVTIELDSSPQYIINQPKGVLYAVNLGGPMHEALNKVVFAGTETTFKVVDTADGVKCQRKFENHINAEDNMYHMVANTNDGFLFTSNIRTHPEFADEISFDLPVSREGDLTMKLYSISGHLQGNTIRINQESQHHDQSFSGMVDDQLAEIPEVIPGYTAKVVSLPFVSKGNNVELFIRNGPVGCHLGAIMVHDDSYKEPELTKDDQAEETKIKQKLADTLVPLDRTLNLKQIKIAGWSSNLLVNPSGENGDMTHWNYSGNWIIEDGGDETEKTFVSSFMTCSKNQEIDLSQVFSAEHLDSSPEIQVSESFHEGKNHGGFYSMTASLITHDGSVVQSQTTGEQGTIQTHDWIKVCFTFKDYGPGVRSVAIETTARDDKYWGGHFGSLCSAACIRVKNEVIAASGDNYSDIQPTNTVSFTKELGKMVRSLYDAYDDELKEMQELIEEKKDTKAAPANQPTDKSKIHPRPTQGRIKRKKRELRIFVSSTFRDFTEEREVLIKKVFRELNRICLDRGVFFTYVDLRWGITESQTRDGETISICLREIEKCRPYFICLLGDRYGWSQTEKNPDELLNKSFNYAVEKFDSLKWVDQYRYETSVTKLEVLHGALNKEEIVSQGRRFFYLREPRIKREDLPPPDEEPEIKEEEAPSKESKEQTKKKSFLRRLTSGANNKDKEDKKKEEKKKEEKKKEEKKKGETQWQFDKQQSLREYVQSSAVNLRRFATAEEGCELIKKDLIWCFDEDFPPGTELTPLQREHEAHLAFADPRRRIYIGGTAYIKQINEFLERDEESGNTPLVILGESGSGKSALVANWSQGYQEKNPSVFLFIHFIGSSSESASHLNLLRRLYEEMKQFFGFDMSVPSSQRNLVLELSTWLQMAANQAQVVLVLDALNQLDSGSGLGEEQDLKWIPKRLPKNVFMVLSTLPGRAMDAVTLAGWPTFQVHPLDMNEKSEIVTGYMNLYGKTLNDEQRALIIDAKQTNNPLYLKALLDEVRVYGSFFQLTTAIKQYLAADSPGELFVKILERFEDDFEQGLVDRPGLVRDATVALWCSRRGMSEAELLEFLKIPSRVWSPFYLSLEENLVNRNGIVNFFHDHLRQAVERKYLSTPELKREAFLALANWFNTQDIDDRYVDEVPYCLAKAKEFGRLRATILNTAVFERLMGTEDGKFQLNKSWQLLGGYAEVENAYLGVLSQSGESGSKDSLIRGMAGFFTQLGLLKGARFLNQRLLSELEARYEGSHATIVYHHTKYQYKTRCNHPDVIEVLISLGTVSIKLGELDTAYKHFQEALQRQTQVRTPHQKLHIVKALLGVGSVFSLQGNANQAIRFLRRAEEVATDVLGPKHHYVAAINGQIGQLYYSQSKLDDAMILHLWDLKLTQSDVGLNHPRVAAILNNCGLVLDDMNDEKAGAVFKAVLGILMEAYGKDHVDVATVRYNLGAYFFATNMYQRAKYQFDEALRIFVLFLEHNHPSIQATNTALEKLQGFTQ